MPEETTFPQDLAGKTLNIISLGISGIVVDKFDKGWVFWTDDGNQRFVELHGHYWEIVSE